ATSRSPEASRSWISRRFRDTSSSTAPCVSWKPRSEARAISVTRSGLLSRPRNTWRSRREGTRTCATSQSRTSLEAPGLAWVHFSVAEPFRAELIEWGDDPEAGPVLLLEDLSRGHWPPPWSPERVERVRDTLEAIHRAPAPSGVRTLESERDMFRGWAHVAEN